LAELVGDVAQFTPDDHVLDVGFGYADQDLFWMERYGPAHIHGLNTNQQQVDVGNRRVSERQLERRIRLSVGSATAMPFAPDSFDVVVALESAHHFVTRDDFFREAYRVLRAGGRIVTAEALAAPSQGRRGVRDLLTVAERQIFAAWPRENWYSSDVYAEKLAAVGFEQVDIKSIRQHIYPPLLRYLARRLREPEVRRRMNRIHRRRWLRNATSPTFSRHLLATHDYVIAIGHKSRRSERVI
jgi:erythromycin 3''-O-methyltransferase